MDTDLTGSTEQVESKWVLVRDALSTHCQWGICLSWTEQIFRENCLKNIQSSYSFFFSFSGGEVYCGVQVLSLLLKKITIFGSGGSSLLCVGFFLVLASGGYSSLQCSGFSLQWLLVEAPGLQSAGSAADMHRLTCSSAHGIFPDQESNLCPLHWQVDSLPWTTSKVPNDYYREIHIEHRKRRESWEPVWIISSPPDNCLCWFSLSPGWWLM